MSLTSILAIEETLLIGVASIDKEHHQLFTQFEKLIQHPDADTTSAVFSEIFSQMGTRIAAHFESEESVLRACGMPADEITEHVAAHNEILEQYTLLNMALMEGDQISRPDALQSIKKWIIGHVLRYDSNIRKYVSVGPQADEKNGKHSQSVFCS